MASTIKRVAVASIGTPLTTELNSLANGSYSGYGATVIDNTAGLYLTFQIEFILASLNPTAGALLQAFMGKSLDGTNYDDPPSATNPGLHMACPPVTVTTGTGAKRAMSPKFDAPAAKCKFAALNQLGAAMAASGNSMIVYGEYEQAV